MVFAILLLLTGLTISSVAIYYSVMGLTAIFAAAFYPIIVMGISLELAKLVAATWLKAYWARIPILLKSYMLAAVIVLMVITSMGIFGFLSKAHSDQSLVSGDVLSRLAVYDEQIKTSKDNIETNRKALQQMDAQVDQMLGRTDTERGAERAVQIRRNQAKERARLQSEIAQEQKNITKLNELRAPIAAENRKIEAEVGPIKYIAKFIYGDNPDANILEKAVTWVIIMIVIVFDPLAVLLLIAAQMSYFWWKDDRKKAKEVPVETALVETQEELTHCPKCGTEIIEAPGIGPFCPNKECDVVDNLYGNIDPKVTEFFNHLRNISRKEDEENRAAEANEKIAEYEQDDGPLTDEQIAQIRELAKQELDQTEEPVEYYPFPTERPLEGDAKIAAELAEKNETLEKLNEIAESKIKSGEETAEWTWPTSKDLIWTNDDTDQEMASDMEELKENSLKRKWKEEHPDVNLKEIKHLYAIGAIENLPWEAVEQLDDQLNEKPEENIEQSESSEEDQKKNYIHSNASGQTDTEGKSREEIEYVQNQEQSENSIWNRIKNRNI